MQPEGFRVGVDIGGTFTDLVILDERHGAVRTLKVPSTPHDPSEAVLNAVRRAHSEFGIDLSQVTQFTHATTVACNTILEGSGCPHRTVCYRWLPRSAADPAAQTLPPL